MKMSRRARRMDRHHKRKGGAGLNMVSLMDIFTILVFFLLVNSSDAQLTPNSKVVKLPESKASLLPDQTVVILVNNENILVQGRPVAAVAEVLSSPTPYISTLQEELEFHTQNVILQVAPEVGREVTILGDKQIPYALLKKIMMTCTRANYNNISLAVMKKTQKQG